MLFRSGAKNRRHFVNIQPYRFKTKCHIAASTFREQPFCNFKPYDPYYRYNRRMRPRKKKKKNKVVSDIKFVTPSTISREQHRVQSLRGCFFFICQSSAGKLQMGLVLDDIGLMIEAQ